MDTLSVSTHSRSSSIFSLASAASSCTSVLPSPKTSGNIEKHAALLTPFVLQWKPQLFSTAFSSIRSTHLHFTAFPPQNVPKPTSERLSLEAAFALLHQDGQPTLLSLFATPQSEVTPMCDIPIPEKLPAELVAFLRSDEWDYYAITETVPLPIGVGSMTSTYRHYVAFRKLPNGIERYIFGPGGLSIHSVCTIRDKGVRVAEDIPRETLYLEERTEVLCSKILKWWFESSVSKRTAEGHEEFRTRWDERFRAEWSLLSLREKTDLLA